MDIAKVLYCKKFLGDNNVFMVIKEIAVKFLLLSLYSVLDEGWALRLIKIFKFFSEK